METRDRRRNLAFFAGALVTWVAVGIVVVTLDPIAIPVAGYLGAVLMGLAIGLTVIPLFWLVAFARSRRIAMRGSWTRAVRRGAWTGVLVTLFVVMRLQGLFQPQLGLFIVALALTAETALSVER